MLTNKKIFDLDNVSVWLVRFQRGREIIQIGPIPVRIGVIRGDDVFFENTPIKPGDSCRFAISRHSTGDEVAALVTDGSVGIAFHPNEEYLIDLEFRAKMGSSDLPNSSQRFVVVFNGTDIMISQMPNE